MPNLHNVQGLIAHRYDQPRTFVLLYRIAEAGGARSFLRRWLPKTPRGDQAPGSLAGPLLHFSFTWSGLRMLLADRPGLDDASGRRELDWAFTDQTPDHPAVCEQLGFIGASAPANWWERRFTGADIHMAVHAYFHDDDQAAGTVADVRASAVDAGLSELTLESFTEGALNGRRPEGGIVHFGFRDGITSPKVDWDDRGDMPDKVDCREFLMGYPNDRYRVAPQRPGAWLDIMQDGFFACVAWIYQDVAAFNQFLDEHREAASLHVGSGLAGDWLAAKLLGRWPDGSPLTRNPHDRPSPPDLADDFGYADDPGGLKCPLWAHIRVVNPRDQALTYPNQVRFPAGPPKLIRRGVTYGPRLAGSVDDGAERGVIGTFFCARVNEQFYTVLRWMQKTEFSDAFSCTPYTDTMQDALLGNRKKPKATVTVAIPLEEEKRFNIRLRDFITYKGVAVLFMPSLAALDRLSDGP